VIASERLTEGVADSGSANASAEQRERNESVHKREKGRKRKHMEFGFDTNVPSSTSEEVA
jgi:hypothetical protein